MDAQYIIRGSCDICSMEELIMKFQELIDSLDLPEHLKTIAQITIVQARLYLLTQFEYERRHELELSKFMKIISSLSVTSEDFYKIRDFIIKDIPAFQQTDFPHMRG